VISKRLAARIGVVTATVALAAAGVSSSASANPYARWIGPGQANTYNGVWCVQHLLNVLRDPNWHHIDEDGIFGPDTEGAIQGYQDAQNGPGLPYLQPDGIVGPQTGTDLLISTYGGAGTDCETYVPTRS
jgi:peptidoglycan hydrolase-like protein with peptidoglycan-binding domain